MTAASEKLKPTVLWDRTRAAAPPAPATKKRRAGGRSGSRGRTQRSRQHRAQSQSAAKMGKRALGVLLVATALTACGSKVMVPPRLDLVQFREVGLLDFSVENAKGDLHLYATDRFQAEIFASQTGVGVLPLGDTDDLLRDLGHHELDRDALRTIGDEYGVPAVFVGHLNVSNLKPRVSLSGGPGVAADVGVEMTIRLVSTSSGATLWSNTERSNATVGAAGLLDGSPYFSAEDPDEAYTDLIDYLVYEMTHDLRPTFERR